MQTYTTDLIRVHKGLVVYTFVRTNTSMLSTLWLVTELTQKEK